MVEGGVQKLTTTNDFIAIRLQAEFKSRAGCESRADRLHDLFLDSEGIMNEAHVAAHKIHFAKRVLQKEGRAPTEFEISDLENMLA
eukprot:6024273-Karenia_brevis.AAC.1